MVVPDARWPRKLVLSGGGIRGVAYVGALQRICEETGYDYWTRCEEGGHKYLREVAGTSIGALVTLLIACGVKPDKLVEVVMGTRMDAVVSVSLLTMMSDWGLSDGAQLKEWVEKLLLEAGVRPGITLGEMYEFTRVKYTAVATDITTNTAAYLNGDTYPSMPVSEAVMMSMSLPLLFKPRPWPVVVDRLNGVRRNDILHVQGGGEPVLGSDVLVRHADWVKARQGTISRVIPVTCTEVEVVDTRFYDVEFKEEHLFLDGGLADNFPVDAIWDDGKNGPLLGFCLRWNNATDLSSIERYLSRVCFCAMSTVEDNQFERMSEELRSCCIRINVGDVCTVNFRMSAALVSGMLESGRVASEKVIAGL